ncbi:MAG: hypothetical protein ABI759_19690 [Candidatus Solibacter sp.]
MLITLQASPAVKGVSFPPMALDSAPETATFTIIGCALCLVGLKLRRRRN